jgi:hypothetical protein
MTIRESMLLESKEGERSQKRYKVGAAPTPFDLQALESPGYVVVVNTTGKRRAANPTPEEREADKACIIVLERLGAPEGSPPLAWVRPGLPFCGELYDPATVAMRCLSGEATATVTIYPE